MHHRRNGRRRPGPRRPRLSSPTRHTAPRPFVVAAPFHPVTLLPTISSAGGVPKPQGAGAWSAGGVLRHERFRLPNVSGHLGPADHGLGGRTSASYPGSGPTATRFRLTVSQSSLSILSGLTSPTDPHSRRSLSTRHEGRATVKREGDVDMHRTVIVVAATVAGLAFVLGYHPKPEDAPASSTVTGGTSTPAASASPSSARARLRKRDRHPDGHRHRRAHWRR